MKPRLSSSFLRASFLGVLLSALTARGQEEQGITVEPTELTRRPGLVGRQVVVDDRVSRFQYHRETGFDQIFLTRAPDVSFELPASLRPTQNPSVVAVKIRGVLHHSEGRWWVDVSSFEPQPSDLDRLNRAVALLPKSDTTTRTAWSRWAEQRGRAYNDAGLLKRAAEIEGDSIRVEAEKTQGPNQSAHWIALAERARARGVPEPEPSAEAHRGFRAAILEARTADEFKGLIAKVERFFPVASERPRDEPDLSAWEKPYSRSPADAYRSATGEVRRALDHRLWADLKQHELERKAVQSPDLLLSLAEEADRLLPDRPELARSFLEKGLGSASSQVGALRLSEVEALAKLYREKLQQPLEAKRLYVAWLGDQKDHRLSPRDAGGRIALADQYEALIDDRSTAVALLQDALKIDPESQEVAEAFRRRGFRRVKGEWVEPSRAAASPALVDVSANAETDPDTSIAPSRGSDSSKIESLRGASPDDVRARMGGRPNRRIWSSSQGQLIEQWIYFGPRLNQYVTILHRQGDLQPRVISYYSLPRMPGQRPSPP